MDAWLYRADGACIVDLRVNDMDGFFVVGGGWEGVSVVSLRMNASKMVLSVLSTRVGCGGERGPVGAGDRPLGSGRWNYSSLLRTGRSFCLVQLLNVQCIT